MFLSSFNLYFALLAKLKIWQTTETYSPQTFSVTAAVVSPAVVICLNSLIAELRGLEARRAAKRSTITIGTESNAFKKQKTMQLFFMVNMASGLDRGRGRPTTTALRYKASILQLIGQPNHAPLVYTVHLWCQTSMFVFKAIMGSCHTSAIADHVTSTGHNLKWDHFETDQQKVGQIYIAR